MYKKDIILNELLNRAKLLGGFTFDFCLEKYRFNDNDVISPWIQVEGKQGNHQ